jgi:hypothetical protein
MAKKHMKTCSTFHLTPLRIDSNSKCWWGCGEKGTLRRCWWECKLAQPLWKTVWRLLKKLEIDLPYEPSIPLLRVYLKEYVSQVTTKVPACPCLFSTIHNS